MLRIKNSSWIIKFLVIPVGILLLIFYFYLALPLWGVPFNAQRHGNPPLTPAWALECWLWEDDINTAEYVDELLKGYAEHDIPVRTILLDSPWSLRYNDFEVDEDLYPEPEEWFKKLQDDGYRVVLWMTPNVNSFSKDTKIRESDDWYNTAVDNGYLTGKGTQVKWWKGKGGYIDYSNPDAVKWWQGLQSKVYEYGIDGWKLDGSATTFTSKIGPIPLFFQSTNQGLMTTRSYMDHYYRNEFQHGQEQNPDFITLARAMDRRFHPEGFAPIDAAPVTWVGDQEHHWTTTENSDGKEEEKKDIALKGIQGFESAIQSILRSAEKGYNVIGSDVAGFSGRTIPPRLYIRWAQFSTFCGLFLNGGHGDRALWNRTTEELEIIREFSWLHTELVPYMYTYVVEGHKGGKLLQQPVKGKYHYMFGDYLLIAPIYKDDLKNTVALPEGNWRYWFDDEQIIEGPVSFENEFALDQYPVYIKEGAIIPMQIERDYTKIGDKSYKGYLTLRIYPEGKSKFNIHQTDGNENGFVESVESDNAIEISIENIRKKHILQVHLQSKPKKVELDDRMLSDTLYAFDSIKNKLIIKSNTTNSGKYIITK